ncbi:MAG: hypothetical protein WDM81_13795 [Rhizomicrobium sp.]
MSVRAKSPPVVSIDEIKLRAIQILPELCRQLAPRAPRAGRRVGGAQSGARRPHGGILLGQSHDRRLVRFRHRRRRRRDRANRLSRCAGDNARAVTWLKDRLGLSDRAPDPARAAKPKRRRRNTTPPPRRCRTTSARAPGAW